MDKVITKREDDIIVKKVSRIWDEYVKENPEMVKPMLKGMPKKAVAYFTKFFKKESIGYVDNDREYCVRVLALMGVDRLDATIFFEDAIKGKY